MFAGRYLWWVLICVAGFLFFAVYFDYITWALVQLSGCARVAGTCGRIGTGMSGELKPLGFWVAGVVLFGCTLWRIHYLRLNLGWGLAVAVWFLVSAPFLTLFDHLWSGQLSLAIIIASVPIAFLYLAAFIAFLVLPLEEETGADARDGDAAAWLPQRLQMVAALAALHAVLLSLALAPGFPKLASEWTGMPMLREPLALLQPGAVYVLNFGTGGFAPAYGMFAIFVVSLGTGFFLRTRPLSVHA